MKSHEEESKTLLFLHEGLIRVYKGGVEKERLVLIFELALASEKRPPRINILTYSVKTLASSQLPNSCKILTYVLFGHGPLTYPNIARVKSQIAHQFLAS